MGGTNGALPHEVLFHELIHAFRKITQSANKTFSKPTTGGALHDYTDEGEFIAIVTANIFISDPSNRYVPSSSSAAASTRSFSLTSSASRTLVSRQRSPDSRDVQPAGNLLHQPAEGTATVGTPLDLGARRTECRAPHHPAHQPASEPDRARHPGTQHDLNPAHPWKGTETTRPLSTIC
jgi:hypothetical protein